MSDASAVAKNSVKNDEQSPVQPHSHQLDGQGNRILITHAADADLADIVEIYNQSILTKESTADLEPVTVADRLPWFREHQNDPQRPLYVVKNDEGVVMAWGSFSDVKSRSAYRISSEISIYVSNQFQRRRLASVLLEWMLEQAPGLGIQSILALIFAHNTASIGLFTKFEFEDWGKMRSVCDMGDFVADVVMMGKLIAPQ